MKIQFPSFVVAADPTTTIVQVKQKRFATVSAVESAMKAQIQAEEDQRVFDAMMGIRYCPHGARLHECPEPECVVESVIDS